MSLAISPISVSHLCNSSPYGFSRLDLISNDGLRQYWEDIEEKVSTPLRLKDLMRNIDTTHSEASYMERFTVLKDQIRNECNISIPEGIYPLVRANFKWIENNMKLQDENLMKLWDQIEPLIPSENRASFSILEAAEVKAKKVRAWFQNSQFQIDREVINPSELDPFLIEVCPEAKLLGSNQYNRFDDSDNSLPCVIV